MLHKRGFWEFIYSLPRVSSCQHDQLMGVYSDRLKKRGEVKKGGSLLRHIPVQGPIRRGKSGDLV